MHKGPLTLLALTASAERGIRFLQAPQFLAASLSLQKPERIMALLKGMTVCLWVSAALEPVSTILPI
jgi:hypothetical protein